MNFSFVDESLVSFYIPSVLGPPMLCRADVKRQDGLTTRFRGDLISRY